MAIQGDSQAVKKSNPAGLILTLLGCGMVGWFAVLLYGYFQQSFNNPILSASVVIVCTIGMLDVFCAWALASGTKTQFLGAMPDGLQVLPASASDFPALHAAELERYTREFEQLGFQHLMDFTIDFRSGVKTSGFARLLVHPAHLIYAEIGQVFPANGTYIPVRCVLISALLDGKWQKPPVPSTASGQAKAPIPDPSPVGITDRTFDREWALSTTDRAADPILYIMRRRRSLWQRCEGASPAELVEMHLRRREHVARHLKLTASDDLSRENYIARQIYGNLAMRRALIEKNMLIGLWEMKHAGREASEWWGDYAKYALRP